MSTINVRQFIDERPISRYQILVAVLTCLIVMFDGLDLTIMAFCAPEIIRDWGISKPSMAPVFGAVFFGLAAGAATAGPISDRYGRKVVLPAAVFLFGLFTLLAATAQGTTPLIIMRALSGVGLGAAIPNAVALMSEFAPKARRNMLVTIIFSGFTLGASGAGLVAAWLIPAFGWKGALAAAGAMPMIAAVFLLLVLPESPVFLAAKGKGQDRIRKTLRKIAPDATIPEFSRFTTDKAPEAHKGAIRLIFTSKYRLTSIMLAVSYFMGLLTTYLLGNWLPVLSRDAGFNMNQAVILLTLYTLAGPVGGIVLGAVMDRTKPAIVVSTTFALVALMLASISVAPKNMLVTSTLICVLGLFLHGTNTALNALASSSFPVESGSTGVSFMHAVGRFGAISSAFVGGVMLGFGWGLADVVLALAVPMLVGCVAMFTLRGSARVAADRPELRPQTEAKSV